MCSIRFFLLFGAFLSVDVAGVGVEAPSFEEKWFAKKAVLEQDEYYSSLSNINFEFLGSATGTDEQSKLPDADEVLHLKSTFQSLIMPDVPALRSAVASIYSKLHKTPDSVILQVDGFDAGQQHTRVTVHAQFVKAKNLFAKLFWQGHWQYRIYSR